MKKVFLAFLMFAGIATCLSGCKKDETKPADPPAPTYSNTISIGSDTYNITLAGLIENINYGGVDINVLAFASEHELTAANNNVICVIYYGDITTGKIDVAPTPLPRVVAIKDFKLQDLLQDITSIMSSPNAYFAKSGSLTLDISNGTYTITTENIILAQNNNNQLNGDINYQGTVSKIELSTGIGSFTINDSEYNIIKAGTLYYNYLGMDLHLVGFLSEDMTKLVAVAIGEDIPVGTFTIPTTPVILIEDLDLSTMQGTNSLVTSGEIAITKIDASQYTVLISNALIQNDTFRLIYSGTIPPLDL